MNTIEGIYASITFNLIEMPELGLTHFPDQQHQDGDHAENAGLPIHGLENVSSPGKSPLSGNPREPLCETARAKGNKGQDKSVSVSLPANKEMLAVLNPLQDNNQKDPSGLAPRKYIPNGEWSSGKVLALTFDRSLPKPYLRYSSFSKTPPLSHNLSRSSTLYSLSQRDGSRDQGGNLPCEPSSDGSNHDAANQGPRNQGEPIRKKPVETVEPSKNAFRRARYLSRSTSQLKEEDAHGEYTAEAGHLHPGEAWSELLKSAEVSPHSSEEFIQNDSVDLPSTTEVRQDQIKARVPCAPEKATHRPRHNSNTIPTSEHKNSHNQTEPNDPPVQKVVRTSSTIPPAKYKNSPFPPLNPTLQTSHSESSGFWYFYLPSTPALHGRHSHNNNHTVHTKNPASSHSAMTTPSHYSNNSNTIDNQEAAMNMNPRNMGTQNPTFPAMNTSTYPIPAMNPNPYPRPYNPHPSGFPAMPNFDNRVPAMPTTFQAQYHNTAASGYPVMGSSAYGVPAMGRFVQPQYYNNHATEFAAMGNHNYQMAPRSTFLNPQNSRSGCLVPVNNTAPSTTSGCINPALLTLSRPLSSTSRPPPQARRQSVTIDLTLIDDDDEENEKPAGPETVVPSTDQQFLKEATTPTSATPPSQSSSTTGVAPDPNKPKFKFPKRNYAWLESGTLLPDMPNAKKLKMSAQESNYRQHYETKAANSTACHFLGLKPVAVTAAAAVPAVDWSKEVAVPSSSSSGPEGLGKASPKKTRGKKEGAASESAKKEKAPTRKEELKEKLRRKKDTWKNGKEVEEVEESGERMTEEDEDEAAEDADFAAEIEAMFDDEDDEDDEAEKRAAEQRENDEMAADIEAMFEEDDDPEKKAADQKEKDEMAAEIEAIFESDGEEEKETRTVTDKALEAAVSNPYLVSEGEEEEEEESGELVIDENPLAPGEMHKS